MSGTVAPPLWQTNPAAHVPGQVGAGNYASMLAGMQPPPMPPGGQGMPPPQQPMGGGQMPMGGQGMMPPTQFQPQQPPMFMPGQQPSVGQLSPNLAMFGQMAQQPQAQPGNADYLTAILQAMHAAGAGGSPPINPANIPSPIGWNPAGLAGGVAPQQAPSIQTIGQIPQPQPAPPSPDDQLKKALQDWLQPNQPTGNEGGSG